MHRDEQADSPKEYSISELAAEFDISTRTIRFYEEKGLIAPRRSQGNQRIYSRRDRARLKLILRGKHFGHTLEDIAEMIGMAAEEKSEADQIRITLDYGERNLAEIRSRIEELRLLENDILSVKRKLLQRLKEIEKGGDRDESVRDS